MLVHGLYRHWIIDKIGIFEPCRLLDHIGWDYGMDLDEHYQDLALIEIDVERRVQFILAD